MAVSQYDHFPRSVDSFVVEQVLAGPQVVSTHEKRLLCCRYGKRRRFGWFPVQWSNG